mgnify:CR=1 FL=1
MLFERPEPTPVFSIFNSETFALWHEKQATSVTNWLATTQFTGKGMSLIPNAQGELAEVIFVSNSDNSYWLCGDLVNQLPAGQYQLNADDKQIKKAYRKLAIQYHPDKVAQLGEDFQKGAKEKFQKVQDSYETIKESRGIN